MSERVVRLIVGMSMLATLFLRWNPLSDPDGLPNWMFIYWVFLETELRMTALPYALGFLAVPILLILNLGLAAFPFAGLKIFYRIMVVILFFLTCYLAFRIDPGWRGLGFWANIAVVSIAALIEFVLVVKERMGRQQDMGHLEDLTLSG